MGEMAHTTTNAGGSGAIKACIKEIHFDLLPTHFMPAHGWSYLTVEHVQSQVIF